jgi:NADH:ubiquinone oxidoreductase subunit 6 (subunit J)
MSVEQGVFALAGAVCVIGTVVAVAYRDPRVAGAALLLTLVSLAALYATLAAPLVAATDGYDLAGLYVLASGRMGVAVLVVGAAVVAGIASVLSVGRRS